jgi:hypothetical protein
MSRFEIYELTGRYWFRLANVSRQVLLVSPPYATRDSASDDIVRMRDLSTRFTPRMTASGLFYFTVDSHDGRLYATSPMYELPADRDVARSEAEALVRSVDVAVDDQIEGDEP